MSDDNIVNFRTAAPSARMKKFDSDDRRPHCQHRSIEVWAKEPIIECAECGAIVDPYYWIRERVADWRRLVETAEWRRDEINREISELKNALRILRGEYATEAEKHQAERALMVMPPRRNY